MREGNMKTNVETMEMGTFLRRVGNHLQSGPNKEITIHSATAVKTSKSRTVIGVNVQAWPGLNRRFRQVNIALSEMHPDWHTIVYSWYKDLMFAGLIVTFSATLSKCQPQAGY